jgi:hypothetical protein
VQLYSKLVLKVKGHFGPGLFVNNAGENEGGIEDRRQESE